MRIELTTSALQVRCSATKLIRRKKSTGALGQSHFVKNGLGKWGLAKAPWKTWASIPLPLACKASALPFELDSQGRCGNRTHDLFHPKEESYP